MITTTTPLRVEQSDVVAVRAPTLGWALRRTLLAILILVVTVAAAATLLYASIDPEEEAPPPSTLSEANGHATHFGPPPST